jgi:hypothetical protein
VVPKNIAAILTGLVDIDQSPSPKFAATIAGFQLGHVVKVLLSGRDSERKKPVFERLIGLDEVWVMCFRDPKFSQWRMFGRFIEKNVFVGLKLHTREHLGNFETYNGEGEKFIHLWNKLVPDVGFVKGGGIDEYISEPYINCDEID